MFGSWRASGCGREDGLGHGFLHSGFVEVVSAALVRFGSA
jgi:hypothetical protein